MGATTTTTQQPPVRMAPAANIGYYRFTDIFFEWHQVLPNSADSPTLKALLQHDTLVHPDHPLMKDPGKGIELFMGTLLNGESRLLFSSAQVEYIRYWLHAMKLTEKPIPIPNSEALLTSDHLRNVSPVSYKEAPELKKAIKNIEKLNKKLRYVDDFLMKRRDEFEKVRRLWGDKIGVWVAIDFESWELANDVVTEFGWSLTRWDNGKEVAEQGHLIVKENLYYTNGQYVPDYRDKFLFGTSETLGIKVFRQRIADLLAEWQCSGPLFLVFHDAHQDIKYMKTKSVQAPLPFLNYRLPDETPTEGTYVVDTQGLFAALEGESGRPNRGLEQMCHHLQVSTGYLHNAGNDAHYTMLALKSMASSDPLDIQREKRWPNHTDGATNGVRVQFQPWEESSDYSDSEGVMPNPRLRLPGDDTATLDPAYAAQMLQDELQQS